MSGSSLDISDFAHLGEFGVVFVVADCLALLGGVYEI